MIVLKRLFFQISDAAEPWQLGSQDAATPIMQGIIDLHHDIFFFLILILVFVLWILVRALWHFHYKENAIPQRIFHGTTIEILRTIFPSLISMFILVPSFAFAMDDSAEALLPHPSPSNTSSSEDSFGLRVLSEPWPITHNLGLESSMKNRIRLLEAANSPFLLGKEKGQYWGEIKECLYSISSQKEYYRLLDFENRDLAIREQKQSCFEVFNRLLLQSPCLKEAAAYSPNEAFHDFFLERRDALDRSNPLSSPAELDRQEMEFLGKVEKDLTRRGSGSSYINRLLGY